MRTVGQLLSEVRKRKGISLDEVEAATKIRRQTLIRLEKSDWQALPSPIFVKGLLKNYGHFLGIPETDLLAFYRREFDEKKVRSVSKPFKAEVSSFRLTPKWVTGLVALIAVFSIVYYLFVQYQNFTGAPLLELTEPKDNQTLENNEVNIVGRTWPDSILKVNGQDVQLSPGGSFSVAISLTPGVNTVTVTAANRFGKIATEKRTLVVKIAEKTKQATSSASLSMKLKIGPSSANVMIEVDGKTEFEGVLVAGTEREINGQNRVRILTKNAGSTKILYQGSEILFGKEGETVEKSFP